MRYRLSEKIKGNTQSYSGPTIKRVSAKGNPSHFHYAEVSASAAACYSIVTPSWSLFCISGEDLGLLLPQHPSGDTDRWCVNQEMTYLCISVYNAISRCCTGYFYYIEMILYYMTLTAGIFFTAKGRGHMDLLTISGWES